MRVLLEDLADAMDWSSEGAYLNADTGETTVINDELDYAMRIFEDLPEGASDEDAYEAFGWGWEDPEFLAFLRGEGRFLPLPDSYDIDERRIMRDFAFSLGGGKRQDALLQAVNGRKPFSRFKDAPCDLGIQQQWYDYKEARLLEIAREWCLENGVDYAYRSPDKVLARRKVAKADVARIEDAEAEPGDAILSHGFFEFNWTTLTDDIRRNWEGELEEIEIDVDLWGARCDVDPNRADAADRPEGTPLVLEISPDRRMVAPDDPHSLFLCCVLADGDRWLSWAKRVGKKAITALLVPMEVHSEHICLHKKEYVEYWNGKIDELVGDAERKREPARKEAN